MKFKELNIAKKVEDDLYSTGNNYEKVLKFYKSDLKNAEKKNNKDLIEKIKTMLAELGKIKNEI